MKFIEQLKQEVRIRGDMETDFRSRRYQHAQALAHKYIDLIEEEARNMARTGLYERSGERSVISGFCVLNENDFTIPLVQKQTKRNIWTGKKRDTYTMTPDNELFAVFESAFRQLCFEEDILYFPFQAQIMGKDGKLCYHTLPMTILKPKKEKIQAFGFPYQIEF